MKTSFIILLAFLCICNVLGQQTNRSISYAVPAIPYAEYRALKTSEQNRVKELPNLDYWGVGSLEWETQKENPTATSKRIEEALIVGVPCQRELLYESQTKGLKNVRHLFASGVTNRLERFQQYQILKSELIKIYHAPTHNLKPDEVFRGADAYVQGLDPEYCLEWEGPETILSLRLSDSELCLEFRQAASSQASIMKERVRQAKNLTDSAQQKLKQMQKAPDRSDSPSEKKSAR